MMGQTHLAGGVALAITAEAASHKMGFTLFDTAIGLDVASGLTVAAAVGIAGIASLLPDLDHAKSKVSNHRRGHTIDLCSGKTCNNAS